MEKSSGSNVFKLGAHNSISGGVDKALERALELETNSTQIFSHNVRSWEKKEFSSREIEKFREKYHGSEEIRYVVIHTSYLINLASPEDELWRKSIKGLEDELIKADKLGVPHINTHIGAHTGSGREEGLQRVIEALNEVSEKKAFTSSEVKILLENTSGGGTTLGKDFSEIGYVLKNLNSGDRFGFCFDTCHGYAAGYSISTESGLEKVLEELKREVGIDNLQLVHLNDSKGELGSNVDRHEHIGKGKIGLEGFKNILNHPLLRNLPFIIETPKEDVNGEDGDVVNLRKLKNLRER